MSRTKFEEFGSKTDSTIGFLKEELKKIRSGRANPALVEDILIEAYDEKQPLKNLASINVVDATLLTVQPWDKTLIDPILKTIQESNIGSNPVNAGDFIRIPLPHLTEEQRIEYVKFMKEKLEEARIAIRALRKDVLVGLEFEKKESELSEDEFDRLSKKLQSQVDKANEEIEEIGKKKEGELMSV